MLNSDAIIKAIRRTCDKDSKAYKVTEYYIKLTSNAPDEGWKAWVTSVIKSIEKELERWIKKNQLMVSNKELGVTSPEENALCLIKDLRERGIVN